MFKTILSFLLFSTISAKSQNAHSLIGDWKFKAVANAERLDSTAYANLKMAFREIEIHLMADKSYSATFFKKEEGNWSYNDSLKLLILSTPKKEDKINIIEITEKTLTLEIEKGAGLILEKKSTE